jgi:hypothetical protein
MLAPRKSALLKLAPLKSQFLQELSASNFAKSFSEYDQAGVATNTANATNTASRIIASKFPLVQDTS